MSINAVAIGTFNHVRFHCQSPHPLRIDTSATAQSATQTRVISKTNTTTTTILLHISIIIRDFGLAEVEYIENTKINTMKLPLQISAVIRTHLPFDSMVRSENDAKWQSNFVHSGNFSMRKTIIYLDLNESVLVVPLHTNRRKKHGLRKIGLRSMPLWEMKSRRKHTEQKDKTEKKFKQAEE